MDFAEASSLKDMDVRRLLRENSSLRSAAASAAAAPGNTIGGSGGRAAAMQAAMQAAETEVNAAIGDEGVGVEDGDGGLDVKQELDEEEKEEDDGDRYEQGEHSFVVISDTEEEEEEEDSDDDDDDEDDEWLPGEGSWNEILLMDVCRLVIHMGMALLCSERGRGMVAV